jgi:hypothetical protein
MNGRKIRRIRRLVVCKKRRRLARSQMAGVLMASTIGLAMFLNGRGVAINVLLTVK